MTRGSLPERPCRGALGLRCAIEKKHPALPFFKGGGWRDAGPVPGDRDGEFGESFGFEGFGVPFGGFLEPLKHADLETSLAPLAFALGFDLHRANATQHNELCLIESHLEKGWPARFARDVGLRPQG